MIMSNLLLSADRLAAEKAILSNRPAAQILSRNTTRGISMKQIELTQGKVALVDDCDFEWLNQWRWYPKRTTYGGFAAQRSETKTNKTILMHRIIMNTPQGMDTDHINHDTLDNRRLNLRICTRSQNNHNRSRQRGNYKGVSFDKSTRKWRVNVWVEGTRYEVGYFEDEIEAAKAYDKKAKELVGEFVQLNFDEGRAK